MIYLILGTGLFLYLCWKSICSKPRKYRSLKQRRVRLRNLNEMGDLRYHWR